MDEKQHRIASTCERVLGRECDDCKALNVIRNNEEG